MKLTIKRVYDEPGKDDGTRILIDRLCHEAYRRRRLASICG